MFLAVPGGPSGLASQLMVLGKIRRPVHKPALAGYSPLYRATIQLGSHFCS